KKQYSKNSRCPNKGAMHPLLSLCVVWLLSMALALGEESSVNSFPRRTVPYHRDNIYMFHEEGVFNYSTMLLREDLGLLVIGAREAVYAVDLHDVSKKLASVKWEVTQKQREDCGNKGKNPETECKNYIRILHEMEDNRMYVCGTNAFDPMCDYMSYVDGKMMLENKTENGKGKCPFDPYQKYASLMVDDDLYSATSMNFLGSEPVLIRSPDVSIRTEFKTSWLNEPHFVSMAYLPESVNSTTGDDDKVYLFFSETAVECDCYNKPVVSRVARVCKGDLGGQRTLQKKWTSFLKATLECPVLESQPPYIIQDTYRWCDPKKPWTSCLFYTIFTPQSDTSDLSAVCVYKVSDISQVFSEGKYKTPVTVETSFVKWVMYSGEVPSPRPGACIDNAARKAGINETLDLPDQTLEFVKNRPLMDQVIQPMGGKPSLVRKGAMFTQIIVNQVQAEDNKTYHVMFIGTENGTIVKAVNYNGEMFIIEEVHVFKLAEPIKILRFSTVTDQLYAGSDSGVVQIPLATCERSSTCMDCVLSRDPYCGWDDRTGKCVTLLSKSQNKLIQSVQDGDASLCPKPAPSTPVNQSVRVGGSLKLHCTNPSNHAVTIWEQDRLTLNPTHRHHFLKDGLLILNASDSDAGLYSCLSVERSKMNTYTSTVVEYQVTIALSGKEDGIGFPHAQRDGLHVAIAIFAIAFFGLFSWNIYKGHFTRSCRDKSGQLSPE
ncbi:hypothetical protein NL108_018683, partial [Boleophthalmus pectinirostris]